MYLNIEVVVSPMLRADLGWIETIIADLKAGSFASVNQRHNKGEAVTNAGG